jgi:16S rRNA (guanine(1405)-N(7))-methyltransferase
LDEEARAIAARYRVDAAHARGVLARHLAGVPEDPRRADWREGVRRAREEIYKDLRRYIRGPAGDPVRAHASTAERIPDLQAFHAALLPWVGGTVLDVGAGLYPLQFPLERVRRYVALEADLRWVQRMSARGPPLEARRWRLGEPWPDETFDTALLFKVVPVFERQHRAEMAAFAHMPARRWIVSGSREALAKRRDIGRRERGSIERFLARFGRRVIASFDVPSELVVVAE